jgi:peptidoglycan/xylan/chitin deacetylase (PgdA/CDA1 family)
MPAESALSSESEQKHKMVAFTFDDGPGDYTASLLDGDGARDAHATFFIATNRVSKANSELIRRMDRRVTRWPTIPSATKSCTCCPLPM